MIGDPDSIDKFAASVVQYEPLVSVTEIASSKERNTERSSIGFSSKASVASVTAFPRLHFGWLVGC